MIFILVVFTSYVALSLGGIVISAAFSDGSVLSTIYQSRCQFVYCRGAPIIGRLLASLPIIGQFADNWYWPFDTWHRPIISRLIICFSKQNNKKCF